MNRFRLPTSSIAALIALSLLVGPLAAAPRRGGPRGGPKAGPKVGPKAGPKAGPKSSPKAGPKPGPKAGPILGPKTGVKKPVKPGRKPGVKVVPRPELRVVPRPGVRAVVPVYVPRVVVGRPRPTVVVTSVQELAVVPVKEVGEEEEAYKVIAVDDAYTLTLLIDGRPTPVRMLGVEPPLVATSAENQSGTIPEAALHFVRNLLVGEFVYLDHDPGLAEKDADGNLIAYLYRAPDKLFVNLELIRQGYGLAAEAYSFECQEALAAYQAKAQADGKGIWATVAVKAE